MNHDRRNGIVALVVAIGSVIVKSVTPHLEAEGQIPFALVCGLVAGYVLGVVLG